MRKYEKKDSKRSVAPRMTCCLLGMAVDEVGPGFDNYHTHREVQQYEARLPSSKS